jgi:1-acyl-sn-glycerol-3-phosphate acyltransferase
MANHYTGIDYPIIYHAINYYTNYKKNIYTIVKHNLFGDEIDKSTISNLLGFFKNDLYKLLNFIPYIRDNKDSGNIIKQEMMKIINNNDTILLFPEGTGTKNGIPNNFKSGSFRFCSENNIKILPLTIIFNKNIGASRNDNINLNNWFNINAKIIIHEPIYDSNWLNLKNKVFNKIKEPFNKI